MNIKPSESNAVKKARSKLRGPDPLPGDNALDSLRLLVREHRNVTRMSVATGHMALTEVTLRTGEKVRRDVPAAASAALEATSKALALEAGALKTKCKRALRALPIYDAFFAHHTFAVPMLASYLAAQVDIRKSEKPSQLRRFCGLAVIDGREERPRAGEKRHYNETLRTQLYLAFEALWKNQRHDPNNKYLAIWRDAKHRDLHKEGVESYEASAKGEPVTKHRREVNGKVVPWDGHAHTYGRHKAADVFIEDLYIVWRALEGLPVWPSYYAAKLGYHHGGKICVNEPKMLTLEEAQRLVGIGAEDVAAAE